MYEPNKRTDTMINIAIAASVVTSLVFLLLFLFGYGHIAFAPISHQNIYINGHKVSQTNIKLRPGTYDVTVLTPKYESLHTKVSVSLFQTKKVEPKKIDRSHDDIAASALGSYGYYGPPELSKGRWFHDDAWLAGSVGPGSATSAAFYYEDGVWSVKYFKGSGYPSDDSKLPPDVAAYVQSLQTSESPQ